ncbi:hypothetical protein CVT26_015299 [Gymnopilus dilepis]|uniref:Cytochrome P450 n=1 Tax=Gymnopilus dilepis TaxID=231916 RepID=A0A409YE14_9AGAR|nr:hypothetical protein CVT26_015299 [Gymnopilus dilepis]
MLFVLGLLFAVLSACLFFKFLNSSTYRLRHIPTVGSSSSVVWSYIGAVRYYFQGHKMVQEGYEKYHDSVFKIPTMSKWLVVLSGPRMCDDLRRASDHYLSQIDALTEVLQLKYTAPLPSPDDDTNFHINFLRAPLGRHLVEYHQDIRMEIGQAIHDVFDVPGKTLSTTELLYATTRIFARANHRLFVGSPLYWSGRNTDYLRACEQFASNVFLGSQFLLLFPRVLRPIFGLFVKKVVFRTAKLVKRHISPLLEARLRKDGNLMKYGEENQAILIDWMLSEMQNRHISLDIDDIVVRVLLINFASLSGVAAVLSDSLVNIASYPEYVTQIRNEIEDVLEEEGWSREALAKMVKLDSFMKESMRLGAGGFTGNRRILRDFTLSNGITIPAGSYITFANRPTHNDARYHDHPTEFQGFRFVEQTNEQEGLKGEKSSMVSLSHDFLAWGLGKHACPGRFFASHNLKLALAHILLDYDVEFAVDAKPRHIWFQAVCLLGPGGNLVFKKRK